MTIITRLHTPGAIYDHINPHQLIAVNSKVISINGKWTPSDPVQRLRFSQMLLGKHDTRRGTELPAGGGRDLGYTSHTPS